MYDVIIIGAGPAGESASLYTKRANKKTLIIHNDNGGLKKSHKIENYYGFKDGIEGEELYKIGNGIYQRFFTEEEIASSDVQPSRYTTNTSWYYNMREIGGISTNASNDGRFEDYPKNEHYNSNNTAEPYLFELGYIDNLTDLQNMINNQSGYADAIANALQKYLEAEK